MLFFSFLLFFGTLFTEFLCVYYPELTVHVYFLLVTEGPPFNSIIFITKEFSLLYDSILFTNQ